MTDKKPMPYKDPGFIDQLLSLLSPEVRAALMAMIISVLRILYDKQETKWQRIVLESLLCGAITYSLAAGLRYFNLESGVAVFSGGVVGLLGVEFVRGMAKKLVRRRVSGDDHAA